MDINKDEGIKKATEDQVPAAEEEDILQPYYNHLTPTKIEALKIIEIVRVQTSVSLVKIFCCKSISPHSRALLGNWSISYVRCWALLHQQPHHPHLRRKRHKYMGMGTPLGNFQAWGRCPGIVSSPLLYLYRFS